MRHSVSDVIIQGQFRAFLPTQKEDDNLALRRDPEFTREPAYQPTIEHQLELRSLLRQRLMTDPEFRRRVQKERLQFEANRRRVNEVTVLTLPPSASSPAPAHNENKQLSSRESMCKGDSILGRNDPPTDLSRIRKIKHGKRAPKHHIVGI